MPFLKLLLFVLLKVAIATLVVSLSTLYSAIRPQKFVSNTTPADFNLQYENVTLVTEDNLKLDTWFIPAANKTNKAVVVMHGYPFDKGNILPPATFLHDEFNLVLFDFRYLGKSEGSYNSVGIHEKKDLAAAVKYLHNSKNQTKIGALGFSLGGAVAIMGAKQNNLSAVVSDSSYASLENMLRTTYKLFRIFKFPFLVTTKILSKILLKIDVAEVSPEKSIKELKIPIMIIHGSDDDQIPVDNAYQLKSANQKVELWIIENAGHGFASNVAGKEYEKRVLKFFKDHLT